MPGSQHHHPSAVLSNNQFGEATYLTLAAALRTNTSLRDLYLFGNRVADKSRVEEAFVQALWFNPNRPVESRWWLYKAGWLDLDYGRLKERAEQLGHPSMLSLLLWLDS